MIRSVDEVEYVAEGCVESQRSSRSQIVVDPGRIEGLLYFR